jgi:hypothetical protein
MKTRYLFLCAALCAAAQGLAPAALRADEGEEVLTAHPMAVYPGSVEAKDGDRLARLSKDDLPALRKFFESKLQPGDKIEEFKDDGEAGFNVTYTKKMGRRDQTVQEVRVSVRTEKRPPHQAFGELNAQVSMGRHKEAELRALEKEYGGIDTAYFRAYRGEGRARDEAERILEAADKEAHPDSDKLKAAGRKSKVSAGDKAEAQEFKKKMKELKAQGDIAGMMALAQSNKKFQAPPEGMADAARMAAEDRNRDTWDLWVKCLKDTKAAAYRTRLEYTADSLK